MNDQPIEELSEEELSRRVFIGRLGGTLAGLAGLFGLAKTSGIFDEQSSGSGYGSTAYGGHKEI